MNRVVKILTSYDCIELENELDYYYEYYDVVKVQYKPLVEPNGNVFYTAMVVYA